MDTEKLFATTVNELEKMLHAKCVVGEPLKIDGTIIVPLVSLGVAFGLGSGENAAGKNAPGQGLGMGGGGGVKPVAVVVLDAQGVRVESLRTAASVIGKLADSVAELAHAKLGPDEPTKLEG
jgi:uncharacterized spore protein YtfJ